MGGSNGSTKKPKTTASYNVRRSEQPSMSLSSQQIHVDRLPDDNQLHDYTQAAKDFLDKQAFKKLARERNLNLHGKLIKSRVNIDPKSIQLTQDQTEKTLYWLSFEHSSKEKCKISIYYCANQITNSEGLPTYFTIPPQLPSASIVNVGKGLNKKFEDEEQACFDVQKYEGMPLFNCTQSYYPCIIAIEPRKQVEYDKDGVSDYQSLITY